MKAPEILSQAQPCLYETWITLRGIVRRHEVEAVDTTAALEAIFTAYPAAEAASARLLQPAPARDALAELDRRARP